MSTFNNQPSSNIEITHMTADEWESFKKIRIESLQMEPTSVGGNLEGDLIRPDNIWASNAAEYLSIGNQLLLVKVNKEVVGLAGISFDFIGLEGSTDIVAKIWGVYLRAEMRGKGIGKFLMEEVIATAKSTSNVKKVQLSVNPTKDPAVNLYTKYGFRVVGKEKEGLKVGGEVYNLDIMELEV